jgi:hypothetical protein
MNVLFRWYLFYPLAAVAAALIILVSLGPAILPADPRPVAGRVKGNAVLLAGDDLAHPNPSPQTVHFVQRDAAWRATALRVAVRPRLGPAKPNEAGLQILLSQASAARLGRGPVRIEVMTASVPVTTATHLAIGLPHGSETEWQTKPVSVGDNMIAYDFAPRSSGALITAVGVRPVSIPDDYNYGVEIRGIRIIPRSSPTG